MYVNHMVTVCRSVKRVLKRTGSMYLVMGDTYYTGKGKCYNPGGGEYSLQSYKKRPTASQPPSSPNRLPQKGYQPKCLMGIPHRVYFALIDDGWIARNANIWKKSNPMPSSTKDRLTNTYEFIFHFVKNNKALFWTDKFTGESVSKKPKQYYVHKVTGETRLKRPKKTEKEWYVEDDRGQLTPNFDYAWDGHDYWYDLDAIRKPSKTKGDKASHSFGKKSHAGQKLNIDSQIRFNPKGKNPGDVYKTKHDEALKRKNRSYEDRLHVKSGAFLGKNPGDVLSWGKFDLNEPGKPRVSRLWKSAGVPRTTHPKGPNPGDFYQIPTKPFPGAHFAVYPPEICVDPIKSSCPAQVCRKCGKPRTRIVKLGEFVSTGHGGSKKWTEVVKKYRGESSIRTSCFATGAIRNRETVGWSDCGCNAGFAPGVVLDPMCGRGTTLKAARKLGRRWIGIDINPEYVGMARKWLKLDMQLEPYVKGGES